MLFLRKLENNEDDPDRKRNIKCLLYYKLSDKGFVETKLNSVIEVPFERNE